MNEKPRNPKRNSAALIGVATVALAGGYVLRGATVGAQNGAPQTPVVQTPATRDATAIQNAFGQVSEAVEPAVVTITTERSAPRASSTAPRPRSPFGTPNPNQAPGQGGGDPFEDFFRNFQRDFGFTPNSFQRDSIRKQYESNFHEVQERRGGGLGSGMIFRADGLIMTNAHVVSGADTVSVKLSDGREFKKAKVLGIDERTDVAVVKIEATNLPTVKLGDSSQVRVGDWAIAVGNPFGLEHTLTVGVISAKAREVPLNERSPGDYLQTDASINPGNSGGPLLDIQGRVIGVNNAIYSQSGGNVGIGFAIPINTARAIADQLVKSGKITRGYLGVRIQDVTADTAAEFGLPADTKGVLVPAVEKDTPGARAGLQPGDVILAFNGTTVTRSAELQRLVGAAPVGSTAQLRVLRAGETIVLNARLDELKDDAAKPASPAA
ncbi:MAG TPA: trypsin-like peptidase domain-containing protein, partial [Abditibacteriaceae bacterium]